MLLTGYDGRTGIGAGGGDHCGAGGCGTVGVFIDVEGSVGIFPVVALVRGETAGVLREVGGTAVVLSDDVGAVSVLLAATGVLAVG